MGIKRGVKTLKRTIMIRDRRMGRIESGKQRDPYLAVENTAKIRVSFLAFDAQPDVVGHDRRFGPDFDIFDPGACFQIAGVHKGNVGHNAEFFLIAFGSRLNLVFEVTGFGVIPQQT